MKDMNHIVDPRQIDDSIPGALVLIAKFKNARADRRQRSVIAWPFTLLQLPEVKSKILPDTLWEGLENLSGIAFPNDGGISWPFGVIAHESDYSKRARTNIQLNV